MEKAVIDRIVDGKHAVLLVGDEETEQIVPLNNLPDGVKEGIWLIVNDNGSFEIDLEKTERTSSRIKDKMALLKSKQQSIFRK